MAKGRFISPVEKRKILEIYAQDPSMRAKEVLAKLKSEIPDGERVLSLRAVQRVLREDRNSSDTLGDQEWALHLMPTLEFPGQGRAVDRDTIFLRGVALRQDGREIGDSRRLDGLVPGQANHLPTMGFGPEPA